MLRSKIQLGVLDKLLVDWLFIEKFGVRIFANFIVTGGQHLFVYFGSDQRLSALELFFIIFRSWVPMCICLGSCMNTAENVLILKRVESELAMITLTSKMVFLKLRAAEGYEGLRVLLSRPCRWIMSRKSLKNPSLHSLLKDCCFIRSFPVSSRLLRFYFWSSFNFFLFR